MSDKTISINDLIEQERKARNLLSVREIAKIYGVSEDTIKNAIRRILPNKMKNGIKTFLNQDEITLISQELKNNQSINNHLTYEVSSQVNKINTELEIKQKEDDILKQAMEILIKRDIENKKTIEQQKITIQEQQKTIEEYKLTTQEKIEKDNIRIKISNLIRKKSIENFNGDYGKTWNYYYELLSNRHCFNHKITMKWLKDNPIYLKELLEIVLNY